MCYLFLVCSYGCPTGALGEFTILMKAEQHFPESHVSTLQTIYIFKYLLDQTDIKDISLTILYRHSFDFLTCESDLIFVTVTHNLLVCEIDNKFKLKSWHCWSILSVTLNSYPIIYFYWLGCFSTPLVLISVSCIRKSVQWSNDCNTM